jgi:hypothetical protein
MEVVGLVAGIATLSKCIPIVASLADAFKGHREKFECWKKILEGAHGVRSYPILQRLGYKLIVP